MASNTGLFGLELILKLAENEISKKEDVLLLVIHWYLTKCGFKCLGLGDNKTLDSNETGSETLPNGWSTGTSYALRYVYNVELYILRGIKTEGIIVFNFLKVSNASVSNISFNIDERVKSLRGPIHIMIPEIGFIVSTIEESLVFPVFEGSNKEATTQTTREPHPGNRRFEDDFDPLRIGTPRRNIGTGMGPDLFLDPSSDPFSVGRGDLDPLGRGGGGGMLFNPIRNPRDGNPNFGLPQPLPRGSVPPGARFDPFGPPGRGPGAPGRNFGPDPDHFPPPGYDDMFM